MKGLTTRRQAILKSVVREFTASAMPVGSKTIAEQYGLGVSPATIRNEMACLEEQGFLIQPYTSAGRIPTDKGYRYFVEHLMEEMELPLDEQLMIRHQFHQTQLETEQWLKLAAVALAKAAQCAALVTAPRSPYPRFKHLELISLRDSMVLLVLILRGGMVRQRMLTLAHPPTQMELNRTAARLNGLFDGLSVEGITAELPRLLPLERKVATLIAEAMRQMDEWGRGEMYHHGLTHLLRQPEFTDAENARQLVDIWEERSALRVLMAEALPSRTGNVQVIIGEEGGKELGDCSLVLTRYGVADRANGALGALGPKRMAYGRVISAVGYVADLMSDIVRRLYGNH